jgi:hypothetical protein
MKYDARFMETENLSSVVLSVGRVIRHHGGVPYLLSGEYKVSAAKKFKFCHESTIA